MDVTALPKVELHLHLDCSVSHRVAARFQPDLDEATYRRAYIAPSQCRDLAEFLACTEAPLALLQRREALAAVTEDLFQQLAEDHVLYAEVRYAPLLHLQGGLRPEEVVETVEAAASRAMAATGVEGRLILCTLRHFDAAQSLATARLVDRYLGGLVAGLDLASDEAGFPLDAHRPAFHFARDRGLNRTAHAGEAKGPESVWETLRELAPSRIGHGVRAIEDPALVEHLAQTDVHLEVCPSSNVQIGVFPAYEAHPVARLAEAGVSLGLNTDSRALNDLSLSEEYQRMHRVFGWGVQEFRRANLAALAASFAPEDLKARLASRL